MDFLDLKDFICSESFRRRPAMYLGELSVLSLRKYTDGYLMALQIHHISEKNEVDFGSFHGFVANQYKIPNQAGWEHSILRMNQNKAAKSMSEFFKLFDRFINDEKEDAFYDNLTLLYEGRLKQNEVKF